MQRGANTRYAPATKTGAIDFRLRPDAARADTLSPFHEGPVDNQLRGLVRETGPLPRLDLFPHGLEVPLHAVHADREDAHEAQVLGVLGEHGSEYARDNIAMLEQIRRFRTRPNATLEVKNSRRLTLPMLQK